VKETRSLSPFGQVAQNRLSNSVQKLKPAMKNSETETETETEVSLPPATTERKFCVLASCGANAILHFNVRNGETLAKAEQRVERMLERCMVMVSLIPMDPADEDKMPEPDDCLPLSEYSTIIRATDRWFLSQVDPRDRPRERVCADCSEAVCDDCLEGGQAAP
jgi:hypothetical protein